MVTAASTKAATEQRRSLKTEKQKQTLFKFVLKKCIAILWTTLALEIHI